MHTDRNLLFGVLALQGDLIDAAQFAEAAAAWAVNKGRSLADQIVERGWIDETDRAAIDRLLQRKLQKHGGDIDRTLLATAAANPRVLATLDGLRRSDEAAFRDSLADLPSPVTGTLEYIATLSPTPSQRERYTLTTMHARGGIGQVWLARDSTLDREVALKELRPERIGNDSILRRFVQEARITGQLNHPGVVPVYELIQQDGSGLERPYYTMRFVQGRTLSAACADYHARRLAGQVTTLDRITLVQAFLAVCNTVAFAHSRGVIHRDLKGQNIILGDYGEVILLDWGLAKFIDRPSETPDDDPLSTIAWAGVSEVSDSALTLDGQAMGTPAFMSPEQAAGQIDQIDRRTDVYSLGAILYEILTGQPPFRGPSVEEILRQVRQEPPLSPAALVPRVPRGLEAIGLKALAKAPEQRYATVADLADDVRHWLADEPVSAYPEPWIVRARRWVNRHRTLASTAAAALVVASLALAGLALVQARSNRDLARALRDVDEEKVDAERQLGFGREAVESFHGGVSAEIMLRRPELTDLRRRLLGVALTYYNNQITWQKQRRERLGSIPPHQVTELAQAFSKVAAIHATLGEYDQAIEAYRQAIAIHETNPAPDPHAVVQALIDLADNQVQSGHPADAIRSMREALARFKDVAEPSNPYSLAKLAQVQTALGRILVDTGHSAEGRQQLEQARALLESIPPDPRVSVYTDYLARAYSTLGNLADSEQKFAEALRFHERALELLNAPSAQSSFVAYQAELARAFNNAGLERAINGQHAEGLRALEQGRALRERLVASQPLNIAFRSDLARSYYHLTRYDLLTGAPAEARDAIEKAEANYRGIPPKAPEDVYFQACLLALRSELVGAGKPADQLSPEERLERRKLGDQAMERLRHAIDLGYRQASRYRTDRSLDSLRARPDFQKLVESITPVG